MQFSISLALVFGIALAMPVEAAPAPANPMLEVAPGTFAMGSETGDFDEKPMHEVVISRRFAISAGPVTNASYELFRPQHEALRGRLKSPAGDDDPVVFVSYDDAAAYCQWLSRQENRTYRLPTEAEWEYAMRTHPPAAQKTLVENWCSDWYGPYVEGRQTDPVGYETGEFRVTRGGAYLARDGVPSASNRMGTVTGDRSPFLGFRIVTGAVSTTAPIAPQRTPRWAENVKQAHFDWKPPVDMSKPYFAEPMQYVKIPAGMNGPLYHQHNHDPGITYCDNGDILAIWYSTTSESGRELAIAGARLRQGASEWDTADVFWNAPDRNDHAPTLWTDGRGTIYHFNGLSDGPGWDTLCLLMRTSSDNGRTWTPARIINPTYGYRNQPISSTFQTSDGTIVLPCDAVPGGRGGSALHISHDGGRTWVDPGLGRPKPTFATGRTGAWVCGIHTAIDEARRGLWVGVGRGDAIDGHLAMSVSTDEGVNWTYSATPFSPIGGGQRAVLRKLQEGPLMLISFTTGMTFAAADGREFTGKGAFLALSMDDGKTWPVRKLLTDGKTRTLNGGAWTKQFAMTPTQAEPKGYLCAVQTPDGMMNLISSGVYYRFNLAWMRQPNVLPE